ncbi:hypothetical protein MRY82_04995 [bacterium]|nr:hypothetical protein [bacterium]
MATMANIKIKNLLIILLSINCVISSKAKAIESYFYSIDIDSSQLANDSFLDKIDLSANTLIESYDENGNLNIKVFHALSHRRDKNYCAMNLKNMYENFESKSKSRRHISKRRHQLADNRKFQWRLNANFSENNTSSDAKPINFGRVIQLWEEAHTDLTQIQTKTIPFQSIKGIPIFQYYFKPKQDCWQGGYIHTDIIRNKGNPAHISIQVKYMEKNRSNKNRWHLKTVKLPIRLTLTE